MSHLLLAAAHASTSGKIATPQIRYLTILPVIVMLGGAILVMAVSSVLRRPMRLAVATGTSCAVALGSLGVSLWQWADVTSHGPQTSIDHAVVMDGFERAVLRPVLVRHVPLVARPLRLPEARG